MAIIKTKSIVRTTTDGTDVNLRSLLTGEISMVNYFAVKALKGQMFTAFSADVSTPTTWTATATIDVTKPVLFLITPSDKAVIPVRFQLYMEAFGTNAQFEANAVIGAGGSYTSGGTALTPVCTRGDLANTSGCSVYSVGGTCVGSTSKLNTFWRAGQQFAITKTTASATASVSDPNDFGWSAAVSGELHIVGPSMQFAIHQGSQAGTGFCKLIYIEIPASELP